MKYEIKKLEWTASSDRLTASIGDFSYTIRELAEGGFVLYANEVLISAAATQDAAKVQAQANFKNKVMKYLVSPTSTERKNQASLEYFESALDRIRGQRLKADEDDLIVKITRIKEDEDYRPCAIRNCFNQAKYTQGGHPVCEKCK